MTKSLDDDIAALTHPEVPIDWSSERAALSYYDQVVEHIRSKAARGDAVTTVDVLWLCDERDRLRRNQRMLGALMFGGELPIDTDRQSAP